MALSEQERLQLLAEMNRRGFLGESDIAPELISQNMAQPYTTRINLSSELERRGLSINSQTVPESSDSNATVGFPQYIAEDYQEEPTAGLLQRLVKSYTKLRNRLPFQKQTKKFADFVRNLPEQGVEKGITTTSGLLFGPLNNILPENIRKSESSVASINFIQRLPSTLMEIGLELVPMTSEEWVWTAATLGAAKGVGKIVPKVLPKTKPGKLIPKSTLQEGVDPVKKALPGMYKNLKSFFKESDPDELIHTIGKQIQDDFTDPVAQAEMMKKVIVGISKTDDEILNYVFKTLDDKVPQVLKQTSFKEAVDYKLLSTGDAFLRKQGFWGNKLAEGMQKARVVADRTAGTDLSAIQKVIAKLSDDEISKFTTLIESGGNADTPALQMALRTWRAISKNIADDAEKVGLSIVDSTGNVRPFQARENFFPHVYDEPVLASLNNRAKTQIFEKMVKKGQANNIADAQAKFTNFIKGRGERRVGNLQRAREFDIPGYETDPRKVLPNYILDVRKRIAEAQIFGPKDEIARELINRISREGGNMELSGQIFDKFMEISRGDRAISKLNETLTGLQLVSKLGLGQLTNMGQTTNTIALTGFNNTMRALKQIITDKGSREFGLKSGAILNSIMDDIVREGTLGAKFLKYTGFTGVEQFNRVLASNAGKIWAQELARKVVANPNNPTIRRQLKKLLLDPDSVIRRGGKLTETELLEAGNMASKITQFKTGPVDLPDFFASTEYKLFTQFKSFALNHAKFVKDNVLKEAAAGNMVPLLRVAAFGGTLGFGLKSVKKALRGQPLSKEDQTALDHLIESYATVGGFGLLTDMMSAAQYGEKGISAALLGPTFSDLVKGINALNQSAQGNLRPLKRTTVDQLPLIGVLTLGTPGGVIGAGVQQLSRSRIFPPRGTEKRPQRRSRPKRKGRR